MPFPFTTPIAPQVGFMACGAGSQMVQYLGAAPASLGAQTLIAAPPAGQQIAVLSMALSASATNNANLLSHTTTAIKTGLFYMVVDTAIIIPAGACPIFMTAPGEALDINLSVAAAVGVTISWCLYVPVISS